MRNFRKQQVNDWEKAHCKLINCGYSLEQTGVALDGFLDRLKIYHPEEYKEFVMDLMDSVIYRAKHSGDDEEVVKYSDSLDFLCDIEDDEEEEDYSLGLLQSDERGRTMDLLNEAINIYKH